jgi:putative acetyltransferase
MNTPIDVVTEADYPEIVTIWETSVLATHHFLTEADIQFYKPLVNDYLKAIELVCIRDESRKPVGFLGVAENKIEMLFIHPDWRGKGVGKQLLFHAIGQLNAIKVDVNEDNEQAVNFYKHLGFTVTSRSPLDPSGKPFPILHMELENQ